MQIAMLFEKKCGRKTRQFLQELRKGDSSLCDNLSIISFPKENVSMGFLISLNLFLGKEIMKSSKALL